MTSEAEVQAEIRAEAGRLGILLWRNNRGACTDQTGRLIRYGLGNDSPQVDRRLKSSDLIGLFQDREIYLRAGFKGGVFLAVECKEPGWTLRKLWKNKTPDQVENDPEIWPTNEAQRRELAQWRFLCLVHKAGGLAGFAQSVDDFRRILQGELVLP